MGKNQDPYPRPESGLNIPDHISECLETIFGLKYLNSLMRIRNLSNSGSVMGKNSEPQHCFINSVSDPDSIESADTDWESGSRQVKQPPLKNGKNLEKFGEPSRGQEASSGA